MSVKRSSGVSITRETAKEFGLQLSRKDHNIDLKKLAATARKAIDGSEKSLKVAGDIANGNFIARLWNSGKFAQNVVDSIGHIRDISQVNLALSAVCNDLATSNLLHAEKIDANHREISQQLEAVRQLTEGLLEHLRASRETALLQPIVQGLGQVDAADRDALHGWLRSFSETIDMQHHTLQDEIKKIAKQSEFAAGAPKIIQEKLDLLGSALQELSDHSSRIEVEKNRLEENIRNKEAEYDRQLILFGSEISIQKDLVAQRFQAFDAALRQSHAKLGDGVSQLRDCLEFTKKQLAAERKNREDQDALMLQTLQQREHALRLTIGALNSHWLNRLFWVGGVLLLGQVAAFTYLLVYMGNR
ncbi:hypothetical protein [Oryzisolibacter sp. LB2S]|uniref:hypothetical protein n=1 Tax=Alicycliphilus soli TaxID=3228789 RepID=UPI003457A1BD